MAAWGKFPSWNRSGISQRDVWAGEVRLIVTLGSARVALLKGELAGIDLLSVAMRAPSFCLCKAMVLDPSLNGWRIAEIAQPSSTATFIV